MVDLVDIAVEEALVKEAVHPVMPGILQNEKDGDLDADGLPRREGDAGVEPARLGHGVEEPDLRQLDGEMREQHQLGAGPLFLPGGNLGRLNLILVEIRDLVDDDPGQTAAKVDGLVHDETHDAGREDIVLHVGVPGLRWRVSIGEWAWWAVGMASTHGPETLKDIQMHVVFGELIVDAEIGFGGCQRGIRQQRHDCGPAKGGVKDGKECVVVVLCWECRGLVFDCFNNFTNLVLRPFRDAGK